MATSRPIDCRLFPFIIEKGTIAANFNLTQFVFPQIDNVLLAVFAEMLCNLHISNDIDIDGKCQINFSNKLPSLNCMVNPFPLCPCQQ